MSEDPARGEGSSPARAGEAARTRRHSRPLAVLAFDLDGFKQINDRYGHAAGDLVLREFAVCLKKGVRRQDIAVSIGGDEFRVLLSECRAGQVDRVLASMSNLKVNHNGVGVAFAFSAGWAECQPHESPQTFLELADRMLYDHKRDRHDRGGAVYNVREVRALMAL